MRWTRRLAISTGLAVAAVGIAVPLSLSGGSASAAPAELSAGMSVASVSALQHGRMPAQLKADLQAAWAAPDGQRVAALKAVLQKAVAGDYGTQVQRRAQRLQKRLDAMNPTLRADLEHAIDLPKAQRQAALKAIRQKLRDGAYGAKAHRDARFLHRARMHRLFG